MRTYDVDNYWILGKSVEIKVSSKMAGYKMNLPFNADNLLNTLKKENHYGTIKMLFEAIKLYDIKAERSINIRCKERLELWKHTSRNL